MIERTGRLAKAMAHLGLCSRRDAEKLVKMGRVKVNGAKVTTMGAKVSSSDSIEVISAADLADDVPGSINTGGGEEEKTARKGSVFVDHQAVLMPALAFSGSSGLRPSAGPPRIWLYHKPPGVITSHKDPQNRPTVFEAFKAKEQGSVPSPWPRY